MSEHQYYEFQALDRPLTDKEMRELRGYSTRARITPTSFVNDYERGDFARQRGRLAGEVLRRVPPTSPAGARTLSRCACPCVSST
jgi:hypothetical protein